MKKIIILGGGINQIPLIEKAKEMGYYIILCDFRNNVPGIGMSDQYYQIDTMDYNAVVEVCKKENPNGIITNSEPVMPIMARVSHNLGLIGNTEDSLKKLISKYEFRNLQRKLGLYAPKHVFVENEDELLMRIKTLEYPIIIKPCESSGSRGSKKIESFNLVDICSTYRECEQYSRNHQVVIEEFVEMPSLMSIEGDIFIHHGKILWNGLFANLRFSWAPMVPMTDVAPLVLKEEQMEIVKHAVESIFIEAGIVYGEYNIEGYFNKRGEFFIIEINVRQGGNEIPEFVKSFSGIDISKLLVSTCVGDDSYWNEIQNAHFQYQYFTKHLVFSKENGKYRGLNIDDRIKQFVVRINEHVRLGDDVLKCSNATDIVAIVDLKFNSFDEQQKYVSKIDELIMVNVE